ncbi:unnamed protein product [Lota lota]
MLDNPSWSLYTSNSQGRPQKTDINHSVCSAESPDPLGTPQSELEVTQARGSINTDPVTVAAAQGHLGPQRYRGKAHSPCLAHMDRRWQGRK